MERKVFSTYARSMSQRDISTTIDDIFDFKLSQDKIFSITDIILDDIKK